jgi:hypothetical protein
MPHRTRLSDHAWMLLPLAVLVVLAAPTISYMLPGYVSHLGENYQPLRALKFYSSLGGEFHKYGTLPNFLLLPVYGPCLAYWWLTGAFSEPSGDFPYGLEDPLSQLSVLIFGGRVLFGLLGVGLYAWLLASLQRLCDTRTIVAVVFLTCIGTDWAAAHFLANTRPDGPMYAFVAASLGVYVRILIDGPTLARGAWLSLLAVCAISCKELAGPVYVLPYLGLAWTFRAKEGISRIAIVSVATGVGAYLVINVVYAPVVWWTRTMHWLGGTGTSADVWVVGGADAVTASSRVAVVTNGMLDTLGPGGLWVAAAALLALVVLRPRFWLQGLLPFASVMLLGLIPLAFAGDRFYAVAAVTLVVPVLAGLAAGWERISQSGIARVAQVAVALALCVNVWFATWAWHRLESQPGRVVERSLDGDEFQGSLNWLAVHPRVSGKSRLEMLGYDLDTRSMQQLVDSDPTTLPDRIYADAGHLRFIEDGRDLPGRIELFRGQGLDLESWPGVEGLGYRLRERIVTGTPDWFPFDWMPAVGWRLHRSPMSVYERVDAPS